MFIYFLVLNAKIEPIGCCVSDKDDQKFTKIVFWIEIKTKKSEMS